MLRAFGNQHSTCSPHQAESWPASLTWESGRCVFPRASVHPLYILTLYMSLNFAAAVHALRTDLPSTLPDPHISCLAQELLTMVWLYGKRPCMWPWKAKRMFFGWNADCRMLVKLWSCRWQVQNCWPNNIIHLSTVSSMAWPISSSS